MDLKTIERLKKMEGEVRGICLKSDWDFVFRRYGKEGIKKLEEKMAEIEIPIKYQEINTTKFYPVGWDGISILAIKEIFNLKNEDFEKLGREEVKTSFFLKIFIRYLTNLNNLATEAPKMWRKHYTVGDLEISLIDLTNQKAIVRLKNFDFFPEFCLTIGAYFAQLLEMATRKKVSCKETMCTFTGGDCHEFLLSWTNEEK